MDRYDTRTTKTFYIGLITSLQVLHENILIEQLEITPIYAEQTKVAQNKQEANRSKVALDTVSVFQYEVKTGSNEWVYAVLHKTGNAKFQSLLL